MKNNQRVLLQKARNYACLLLRFRLRNEKELAFRLKEKNFDGKTIKQTLASLKKEGFLNQADKSCREEDVVLKLARARFLKLKNIPAETAKRRIYAYLLRRGFSPEIVTETLDSFS